ncbi:hypothetical protein SAMN02745181_2099 [Rubritalea squalenifaciens DSM 18772]|uniref:Right handed beta helix region n=1 Tax=Rubritalea squalenifaciens DSM 18772 TaxID=1123071 RepID=A0A1M6JEM0_9BACT|nr:right-handed parallel beta-helix repeat-containing protein [Rubritalea squalenifaciens]SHJ45128.1 hypothetical protein SAMN02745181_2099 [Rubritalea squalenifaciens DSM 18772]
MSILRPYRTRALLILISIATLASAQAETITWNVQLKYGITAAGIKKAIADAKAHFTKAPSDQVILEFDKGTYYLEDRSEQEGIINLSHVKPGLEGRLIFKGQGMDKTTLVFSDDKHAIVGRQTYRVTMMGMHMTRKNYTVSQGHVVSLSPGKIILDIQPGFPTPLDIFNPDSSQGRYLRRYQDSKTDPQIIQPDNEQIPWQSARHIEGQRWQLTLKRKSQTANYPLGSLIGIKSKHGGQTYWFMGGSDFIFDSVKWTHKTRGVFRGSFGNIQILNCVTDRAPAILGQVPCLASPGGGPQIGQPWDKPITGNIVRNCRFIGSGDDAVAFFHAEGSVTDCYIQDAFARGILLSNSPKVVAENNELVRCPIQRSKDHRLPGAPPLDQQKTKR